MAEIYLHHRKDKRLYASVYRSVNRLNWLNRIYWLNWLNRLVGKPDTYQVNGRFERVGWQVGRGSGGVLPSVHPA